MVTVSEAEAIAVTADEFYTYPGDDDKPPYWVARHGCTITQQIGDEPRMTKTCDDAATARAEYAEATCDPNDAAAPQVGDTIDAYDHPGQFQVTAVKRREGQGGWQVFRLEGHPRGTIEVAYACYRIIARPERAS